MTMLEAVKLLKKFFPNKSVSLKKDFSLYNSSKKVVEVYEGWVEGYDYSMGHKSFDTVINHFTNKLILDRTFNTKFITAKCDSQYCDALNKTF